MEFKMHDKFCSLCHGYITDEKFKCSECIRSYHIKCSQNCLTCKQLGIFEESWKCGNSQPSLTNIVHILYSNPRFKDLCDTIQSNLVINSIGLKDIEEKAARNIYRSPRELFADMEWIYHNNIILHSYDSKEVKHAKELMDSCMRHLKCHIKRFAPDGQKNLIANLAVDGSKVNDTGVILIKSLVVRLHKFDNVNDNLINNWAVDGNKINDAGVNTINSNDCNETISPLKLDSNACLKFSIYMIVSFLRIIALLCILLTSLNIFHCY